MTVLFAFEILGNIPQSKLKKSCVDKIKLKQAFLRNIFSVFTVNINVQQDKVKTK